MRWRNRSTSLSDELSRLRTLDPHELLSVSPDATCDEIKAAYRNLAKVYHPDKADPFMARHNEEVIKLINGAYSQLMAQQQRHK